MILTVNLKANSIPIFLEKLNYEAILQLLIEFDGAVKARKQIKSPRSAAGGLCSDMICAIEQNGDAVETALAMPEFWDNALEFEQYVAIQAVENRISRAVLMLSSSKAYSWVTNIATDGVQHPGRSNWYHKLASDISGQWNMAFTQSTSHDAIFDSNEYLPGLTPTRIATVKMKRWTYNDETQERRKIWAVTSVVEQWLGFPQSYEHKVRSALISNLTKHIPISVLLLEDVWMMFRRPYSTVIHGMTKQRKNKKHTQEVLHLFNDALPIHPLTNKGSIEYQLLTVVSEETEKWFQLISTKTPRARQSFASSKKKVRIICCLS